MRTIIVLMLAMISSPVSTVKAQVPQLPTPEQFQSSLMACAAGYQIEVSGKLRGSLADVYSSKKSEIEASQFRQSVAPMFLNSVPDADKAKVYELYVNCILKILSGQREFSDEIPSVIELPSRIVTSGKPLTLKAKTILAKDAEILAFESNARGLKGDVGASGNNGAAGGNGSGGSGLDGKDGGDGKDGVAGSSGGEVRIEANEFIGRLHIINSGMPGGPGGNGGKGGNGGRGGSGTNGRSGMFGCEAGPGMGGGGGSAGSGGNGGKGGDGGDGGRVVIRFEKVSPSSSISILSEGGRAGQAGLAGEPGAAGSGGPRGSSPGMCNSGGRGFGADGVAGKAGRTLGEGRAGQAGSIEVNIGGTTSQVTGTFSKTF